MIRRPLRGYARFCRYGSMKPSFLLSQKGRRWLHL
jgi:hypothetical protein